MDYETLVEFAGAIISDAGLEVGKSIGRTQADYFTRNSTVQRMTIRCEPKEEGVGRRRKEYLLTYLKYELKNPPSEGDFNRFIEVSCRLIALGENTGCCHCSFHPEMSGTRCSCVLDMTWRWNK